MQHQHLTPWHFESRSLVCEDMKGAGTIRMQRRQRQIGFQGVGMARSYFDFPPHRECRHSPWLVFTDLFFMKEIFIASLIAVLSAGCATRKSPDSVENYPYQNPLSSPGQKFSGLPPAVQSTVRAQAGAADMYDIQKSTNAGGVVYEITFQQPDLFPPLYVSSDGSVLFPESNRIAVGAGQDDIGAFSGGAVSGLKLSDLPPKVVRVIQEKAPTAEVAYIDEIEAGEKTFYEVSFKDSDSNPKMTIAEDGTLTNRIP